MISDFVNAMMKKPPEKPKALRLPAISKTIMEIFEDRQAWNVPDLTRTMGIRPQDVRNAIDRLVELGFVVIDGEEVENGTRRKRYKAIKRLDGSSIHSPREDAEEKPSTPVSDVFQQQISLLMSSKHHP